MPPRHQASLSHHLTLLKIYLRRLHERLDLASLYDMSEVFKIGKKSEILEGYFVYLNHFLLRLLS
jgi:hypothetical protein